MAILDIVNYEHTAADLIYKYPSDELKLGTQIIVGFPRLIS